jgi:hypothetical protein
MKKTKNQFIEQAKLIHGDKYDYSLVEYENTDKKVKIICSVHGIFEQTPYKHLKKQGCKSCFYKKQSETFRTKKEDFIKKAINKHGDKYDYSLVEYNTNKDKVKIICPIHGEFEQTPNAHISGDGCKLCGYAKTSKNTNSFINESKLINGEKFDYSLIDYSNSYTNVKFICPTHGEFEQTPKNHISQKQGCLKCSLKNTKPENDIFIFLSNYSLNIETNNREILNGQELDIYIPSHKIAIEYNGLYWHSEIHKPSNYHLNKTIQCEKKGIQLIHIFEDEWLYKQDIVKSRLKNLLGLNQNRIYARKCVIKEVSSKESKEFLNKNHIQGNVNSSVRLGLYHDDTLVSLMTFGSLRKSMGSNSVENSYELYRFCNELNTSVIGGASKLLKHFINTYQPKEIISYADRRWSKGNLYEKLGFKFVSNTPKSFSYIINNKREYRFKFRKDVLIKLGFDSKKTSHEIMLERNIFRIYDCGNKKYKLIRPESHRSKT